MRILVLGAGDVGTHLARVLSRAGDVVVMDRAPSALAEIEESLDVLTVKGDVTHRRSLLAADVQKAELVVAVTGSDNANLIGARAVSKALEQDQIANIYPPFDGIPALKEAGSRFAKAFMDLEFPPNCVIPTVGSMQGCFIALGLAGALQEGRDTILFLDPGFPVNKNQTRFLKLRSLNLDFKDFRGQKLIDRVDELCRDERIGGCLWSSPNNPSWIVLTESELRGLAEVFTKYGVVAIEDMAYFGMDFREDYSVPYQPPYQPTIANYMDRVFIVMSSSKLFSYAGQRCGLTYIKPAFAGQDFPALKQRFTKTNLLQAFVHGGVYPTTSGVPQGAQAGLAALLDACVAGEFDPWVTVREYGRRAEIMKRAFLANGFYLVYDEDLGKPLADGFYFTIGYPGMSGGELSREIIHYGISGITLDTTGSSHEGLRACVSKIQDHQYEDLDERLARFHEDHPI